MIGPLSLSVTDVGWFAAAASVLRPSVRAGRAGVNRRGSFSLGMGMLQQTTRLVNNTEIDALEFRCVSGSAFHGGSVPPRRAPGCGTRHAVAASDAHTTNLTVSPSWHRGSSVCERARAEVHPRDLERPSACASREAAARPTHGSGGPQVPGTR